MVYLLHFEKPISPDHTAQHYIGYCEDLPRRIAQHRAGCGARLTEVAKERGIGFAVVRVWPDGDRKLERRLKNRHGSRLCPICGRSHAQPDLFVDTVTLDDCAALAF